MRCREVWEVEDSGNRFARLLAAWLDAATSGIFHWGNFRWAVKFKLNQCVDGFPKCFTKLLLFFFKSSYVNKIMPDIGFRRKNVKKGSAKYHDGQIAKSKKQQRKVCHQTGWVGGIIRENRIDLKYVIQHIDFP